MNHPSRQFAEGHFVLKAGEFNNTDEDCPVPLASGPPKRSQAHLICEHSNDQNSLPCKPRDDKVDEVPQSQRLLWTETASFLYANQ